MTAGIAEETPQNTSRDDAILAELQAIRLVVDELAALLPAMRQAAKFLDNPVARYKAARERRAP